MNTIIKNILMEELFFMNKDNITSTEILNLLENNNKLRNAIYNDYLKQMHTDDILCEIDYRNEEYNLDIKLTNDDFKNILESYENLLENSDSWHECLIDALREHKLIK